MVSLQGMQYHMADTVRMTRKQKEGHACACSPRSCCKRALECRENSPASALQLQHGLPPPIATSAAARHYARGGTLVATYVEAYNPLVVELHPHHGNILLFLGISRLHQIACDDSTHKADLCRARNRTSEAAISASRPPGRQENTGSRVQQKTMISP